MTKTTINRDDWTGRTVDIEIDGDTFTFEGTTYWLQFKEWDGVGKLGGRELMELCDLIGPGIWKICNEQGEQILDCYVTEEPGHQPEAYGIGISRTGDSRYEAAAKLMCSLG